MGLGLASYLAVSAGRPGGLYEEYVRLKIALGFGVKQGFSSP